ncbi:hypothetical protein [Coprobacter fastidiosus]|uniref:Uncharacterized protein n=1 Tax=Coprobacter fastidiosus NSB1 = JCM 33896 TaxID=1349822 RepID=A0A495WJL5_9BACT|nr:hypothetical protein [Coprobacter fastidiosus]ERM89072.1 hypothetical protein NSB1T_11825 [Coprobacter fastidiosus NSB1 = JCM 33896]RKT61510.1 hypothetical protein BC742_0562 [Coprobacter fastidiosus NSB1 = JCM 33896]
MKKKFPDGKSSNPAETNEQAYPVARVCRFLLSSFLEKEQGYVFVNKNRLALPRAKGILSRWSQI